MICDRIRTSVGEWEIGYQLDVRGGGLEITFDDVIDGVPEDLPQDSPIGGVLDVVRCFLALGIPQAEARELAPARWRDGVVWARSLFEQSLIAARAEDDQLWPEVARVTNWWTRIRGAELLRVSAGSRTDDPEVGVVILARASADVPLPLIARPSRWQSVETLETSHPSGSLKIASAGGGAVTFEAEVGSHWVLDLRVLRLSPIGS